jgi:adenylosuccinate lyase
MGNLSLPGNPRYQPKDLQPVFGYDNLFRAVAEVEIATMKTLADIGIIPKANIASLTPAVEQELLAISTSEIDEVEREVTKHDIRAWVRIAQAKVDPGLRRWIHVPLTSYDALDTARALQFVRGHETVKRQTDKVIGLFVEQVNAFALQPQIGRTHGQHALPITVGFWFATILSRLLTNIQSANSAAEKLVGKSPALSAFTTLRWVSASQPAAATNPLSSACSKSSVSRPRRSARRFLRRNPLRITCSPASSFPPPSASLVETAGT